MSYIAKRKNRIIMIAEDKAEEYAKMGYSVAKLDGEKVADPEITTIEGANAEIDKLREEITLLRLKIKEFEETEKATSDSDTKVKTAAKKPRSKTQ